MKGYAREKMREITADRSALRKCRNAVSAGVLSPISSAVGRNGAVGDKESARAGARNYPRRRQILRLRRYAATPHPPRLRRATCLPAGRSVRGSDTPPACHSIPWTPQEEGLRGASFNGAKPSRGRLGRCGGRSETRLPWLGQAAAGASAPVNAGTVLLTDNGGERLCPREDAGNHSRL